MNDRGKEHGIGILERTLLAWRRQREYRVILNLKLKFEVGRRNEQLLKSGVAHWSGKPRVRVRVRLKSGVAHWSGKPTLYTLTLHPTS